MTSTNTFQGMDSSSKPSSRVLRPPGGGSSNLFGCDESPASPVNRASKMASNIFVAAEEPQSSPKRTNPPGGKSSGIFSEGETPVSRPTALSTSNNIFVDSPNNLPSTRSHPNKPKDNIGINALPGPEVPKERNTPPRPAPIKEDTAPSTKEPADQSCAQQNADNHEPRLGPRPRSHNKVIHPPGGKSSVVFY